MRKYRKFTQHYETKKHKEWQQISVFETLLVLGKREPKPLIDFTCTVLLSQL